MIYFKANIKVLREVNHLKLSEIERELGLSKEKWYSYENGIDPSIKDLISISLYFKALYPKLLIDTLILEDLSYLHQNNLLRSKDVEDQALIDSILMPLKNVSSDESIVHEIMDLLLKNNQTKHILTSKLLNSLLKGDNNQFAQH